MCINWDVVSISTYVHWPLALWASLHSLCPLPLSVSPSDPRTTGQCGGVAAAGGSQRTGWDNSHSCWGWSSWDGHSHLTHDLLPSLHTQRWGQHTMTSSHLQGVCSCHGNMIGVWLPCGGEVLFSRNSSGWSSVSSNASRPIAAELVGTKIT